MRITDATLQGATHLPPPDIHGHHHPALEQVISNRRSCRTFAPPPTGVLHLYEVAQLCWAAQGITAAEEPPDEFGHAGYVTTIVAVIVNPLWISSIHW